MKKCPKISVKQWKKIKLKMHIKIKVLYILINFFKYKIYY